MSDTVVNLAAGLGIYLYCYIGAHSTPTVVFDGRMTLFKWLQVLTHMVFWPAFRAVRAYRRS